VRIFGEPLYRVQLVAFSLIWVALALYSYDALKRRKRRPH
jgi:EamA domain-containing membrane protein RarD